ncbi:response regulator transcription factor [Chitinophaga sp. GCM10012297]|uniref:Response regulator transcription factor n=1 Tax=Chitinophaga chungangae TaxID=2821488 RepID=A0ABS3YCY9_9BACT|nr:response regulator [Chitinophaga chungangae]MBO9152546.1 response regulator transcription factor [Chitinophaga chungangae]
MKRILVIVDDLLMIHVIELLLHKEGHDADLAYNGKEAALLLSVREYDLVIADLKLPFPHLQEMTAMLQSRQQLRPFPVLAIIPAAFLTGTVSSWFGIEADETVVRPFCPFELTDTINRLLGR